MHNEHQIIIEIDRMEQPKMRRMTDVPSFQRYTFIVNDASNFWFRIVDTPNAMCGNIRLIFFFWLVREKKREYSSSVLLFFHLERNCLELKYGLLHWRETLSHRFDKIIYYNISLLAPIYLLEHFKWMKTVFHRICIRKIKKKQTSRMANKRHKKAIFNIQTRIL